jgi:hypothetical protein
VRLKEARKNVDDFRSTEVGFVHVEVINSGLDLNADAKVENQSGGCSLPASTLPTAEVGCCRPRWRRSTRWVLTPTSG